MPITAQGHRDKVHASPPMPASSAAKKNTRVFTDSATHPGQYHWQHHQKQQADWADGHVPAPPSVNSPVKFRGAWSSRLVPRPRTPRFQFDP